eukprot:TRINITY_DN11914_c0_g1_i1.p1 TRINITY_DN11914_c0_g1~~TRINITY_DN11914_c0_g1_i1.p1  ORF type:complete len:109 (-),score=7.43 TRINITY_DN11914_c0_g1_i1:461-787(-)
MVSNSNNQGSKFHLCTVHESNQAQSSHLEGFVTSNKVPDILLTGPFIPLPNINTQTFSSNLSILSKIHEKYCRCKKIKIHTHFVWKMCQTAESLIPSFILSLTTFEEW